MPTSKQVHSKIKSKKASSSAWDPLAGVSTDEYLGPIDHASGWHATVTTLCNVLDIPDLTTRSGLRKVHANFDAIYARTEKAYNKFPGNIKMAGGIVGIYAKMSQDAILRNKLFSCGLLKKVMPLLQIEESRHLALRSLTTISHHGGTEILFAIAKENPTLLSLIEDNPSDPALAQLAITTLAHSLSAVISGNTPQDPITFATLDFPRILRVITESTQNPNATSHLIDHAMQFHITATLNASSAYKSYPPAIKFLIAGLRARDWIFRTSCLGALVRLHRHEAEIDPGNRDPYTFLAAVQSKFPKPISDVLLTYGPERCDTYIFLSAHVDFTKSMASVEKDHDLYSLGVKLSNIILRTEFSIFNGMFKKTNTGLPFFIFSESLPHCAKAIRLRGSEGGSNDADVADILDIKWLMMCRNLPAAVDLAKRSILRSPDQAYFYYILSLDSDRVQGLRMAKKGGKCKKITPFLRFQLLQRAVDHAGDMGIQILQECPEAGGVEWTEGISFLMSAWEDAKRYVSEAPPDTRYMKDVLYWLILLTLLIEEKEIGGDMKQIQPLLEKLKFADEYSKFIGAQPANTNMRLAQQTIIRLYPSAINEFGSVIAKSSIYIGENAQPDDHGGGNQAADHSQGTSKLNATTVAKTLPQGAKPSKAVVEDHLAAWLDDMRLDENSVEREVMPSCSNPTISGNYVALYKCSWCENPSAGLKKCSGCAKTRYCDVSCQKAHWSAHKKTCKTSSSS